MKKSKTVKIEAVKTSLNTVHEKINVYCVTVKNASDKTETVKMFNEDTPNHPWVHIFSRVSSYEMMKWQFAHKNTDIYHVRVFSQTPSSIKNVMEMKIISHDANGDITQKPLTIMIDPYQMQTNILHIEASKELKKLFTFNHSVRLEFEIRPDEILTFMFYEKVEQKKQWISEK